MSRTRSKPFSPGSAPKPTVSAALEVQNTRLFPKNQGAKAYVLTGIASRCDWALMTDDAGQGFSAHLHGNPDIPPASVFLSMRSRFQGLEHFYQQVLPKISRPFVLVSGSEDVTQPKQVDKRWRPNSSAEVLVFHKILADPKVIHWFIENRDDVLPKTSSLPVGYVFEDSRPSFIPERLEVPPLAERPLQVFCAHREREGAQWDTRRRVTSICREHFNKFCTVRTDEIALDEYRRLIQAHSFVICTKGGGLDPSPKAWLSLMNGAIPIIRSGPLDDAYTELPVAFVDEWNAHSLSVENLHAWKEKLQKFYDEPRLRADALKRLSLEYWWGKIEQHIPSRSEGFTRNK